MIRFLYPVAAAAILATVPVSASALSTLDFEMTQFRADQLAASRTEYSNVLAANFGAVFGTEDFESFTKVGQIGATSAATLSTKVGSFTTLGGKGSGSTAIDQNNAKGSARGNNLAIRQNGDANDRGGRRNTSFTTAGDKTYLDSNDTLGISWVASVGGAMFDRLLFTLTDPADQGKRLVISAAGYSETFVIAPRQRNGEIFNFLIEFSNPVSTATLSFAKNNTNDGFSIDNISVGAVPLPGAVWLLLGAAGALVAAKRRSAGRTA